MTEDTVWTPKVYERAKKLWADGLSSAKIALAIGLGLTRESVRSKAYRNRKDFPRRDAMGVKKAVVMADAAPDGVGRPWIERRYGECAFPVGGAGADTRSCCAPTSGVYCDHHKRVMYAGT